MTQEKHWTGEGLSCRTCGGLGYFGSGNDSHECNDRCEAGRAKCDMPGCDHLAVVTSEGDLWCEVHAIADEAEMQAAEKARNLRLVLKINCGTHPAVRL